MRAGAVALAHNPVAVLRERLKSQRAVLATDFMRQPHPVRYLARHAALVDSVLTELCETLALPNDCCLAAVGGYGRGELFPGSDVDVLLLIAAEPEPEARGTIERWVQACWDVGLEIGHSVRTVQASIDEASRDITIETSQMEARRLWGDAALFSAFRTAFKTRFDALTFFDAKVREQTQRHLRLDDSAYKLEPNLKDSPGGLRDLHTIHWLAQAVGTHCAIRALARAIAHSFAFTGAAARRSRGFRLSKRAGRAFRPRCNAAFARRRTVDARLLPRRKAGAAGQ